MPASINVLARRCTVLLARPRRFARLLMPISYSLSENALMRRIELATDDRRVFGFAVVFGFRGSVGFSRVLLVRSISQNLIPVYGTHSSKERSAVQELIVDDWSAVHTVTPQAHFRMNSSFHIFSHLSFSSRMVAGSA